jgi:uncharacterized membrane protein YesL
MGLFNGYLKEGPGVSKNAPQKTRFFLFFELFGRKISKLIKLNMMYFACLIPLMLGICLYVNINPNILANPAMIKGEPLFMFTGDIVGLALIIISLFITGPATAGFTYVLRNFGREEHAWVFSDFKDNFKSNYKQGLVLGILDLILYFAMYVAFVFYTYSFPQVYPNMAMYTPFFAAMVVVLAVIYTWMHYYIYVMMVTFKLKLTAIFKNSLLFAFAKLPLNIFISIICGGVILLSLMHTFLGLVAAFIITLSFIGYVIVFSVYPTIDKYMIEPVTEKGTEETEKAFNDDRED